MKKRIACFTYLGLMFIIAVLSLTAAAASTLWSVVDQRDRERELLFVGRQYRQALARYRAAPLPAGSTAPGYPASLDELLRDPRVPFTRRFLRRPYVDPMTGQAQWGLLRDAQGGIVAVHSLSAKKPFKTAGFVDGESFGTARSYRDWVFGDADAAVPDR